MGTQWNDSFILSLKEIALRRVTINVCSEPDILALIEKLQIESPVSDLDESWEGYIPPVRASHESPMIYNFETEWREIFLDPLMGITAGLSLPEELKKQISLILKRVGLQIISWKAFHENYLGGHFGEAIFSKLCWTYLGMLDYRKTAEALIKAESLDALKHYRLSCLNCLDDYIPVFWEKLPDEIKRRFYNKEGKYLEFPELWPCIHDGRPSTPTEDEFSQYSSVNERVFQYSLRHGNKAAAQYFFQKLTPKEKENYLNILIHFDVHQIFSQGYYNADSFPPENFSEVFLYFLSRMNDEQQRMVFSSRPAQVLFFLLDLPFPDLYSLNAEKIWACLSENNYEKLFWLIQCLTRFHYCEFYFPKFLQELYTCSPSDFRKLFLYKGGLVSIFIPVLLKTKDVEIIKIIFESLDYSERIQLLFSEEYMKQYCHCISELRQYQAVKVCLESAMLSKEDTKRLEFAFRNSKITRRYRGRTEFLRAQFSKLIEEINASFESKRNLEDENQTEAKKTL